MDDKLPTKLWIDAHLKQFQQQAMHHYVIQRGEEMSGMVMVKLVLPQQNFQSRIFTQMRDLDTGEMGWLDVFEGSLVPEREADVYIMDERQHDPDLWVIEVESKEDKNPFDGKILRF